MRAFIILGLFIAAASAAKLGYDYAPGVSGISGGPGVSYQTYGGGHLGSASGLIGTATGLGGGSGLVGIGGGYGGSSGLVGIGGGYGGSSGLIGTGGSGLISTGGSGLISTGGSGLIGIGGSGLIGTGGSGLISTGSGLVGGGGRIGLGLNALDSVPQSVEYSKQFFFYSAPEEHQDEGLITQQLSNVLKKNLQVVFIKAPENNAATNAALQLAKQAIEQRTAIYVLSKENDGAQLVGQLQQIQENVPTTPEVRIIKYRTPEDIAYARDVIQSQYENIGGSSQVVDGGIAPVLNYASGSSSHGSGLGGGLGVVTGGSLSGSSLSGGLLSGQLVGGSGYGTGINKIIGGGTTFLTGGASNTNANYLPVPPLKK